MAIAGLLAGLWLAFAATAAAAPFAYVTNLDGSSLSQYDAALGPLTPLSPATVSGFNAPLGVAVSRDGGSVYVADAARDAVYQYTVGAGGQLTPMSPASVPAAEATGIATSPDGGSVYVTGHGASTALVHQFTVGPDGALTAKTPASVAAANGAAGVVVSPDGANVYTAGQFDSEVSEYAVGAGGALTPIGTAGIIGDPHEVAVSPDGGSVYVTVTFPNEGVWQFDRGADGLLTPKDPLVAPAGPVPNGIAVSLDGGSVYVTNLGNVADIFTASSVSQFTVGAGGLLTPKVPATVAAGVTPIAVALSPDGSSVYVTNYNSDTVSQYTAGAGGLLTPMIPAEAPTADGPFGLAVGPATTDTTPPSVTAVVRSSTTWELRDSLTGEPTATFSLGTRPLVPFMGDWDGNGSQTPGTYGGGVLRLYDQIPPEASPTQITFGDSRGFPVAGDFDGDGRDDVAIYRNGSWQIRFADDGATSTVSFGSGSWPATVPVAGDWDGDGSDGIGTYTLASGTWNLRQTASSGAADAGTFVFWTGSGSYPVVGDWDGDGIDTVGVKNGVTWSVNNQNDMSAPDLTFDFGLANDLPLSWTPGSGG